MSFSHSEGCRYIVRANPIDGAPQALGVCGAVI